MAGFRDMNFGDMLVLDGLLCALVTSGGQGRRVRGRWNMAERKIRVFLFS